MNFKERFYQIIRINIGEINRINKSMSPLGNKPELAGFFGVYLYFPQVSLDFSKEFGSLRIVSSIYTSFVLIYRLVFLWDSFIPE